MTNENDSPSRETARHTRLAIVWTVLGSLGTLAIFPYILTLNPSLLDEVTLPLPVVVLVSVLQTGLLLLLSSWVGLRLGAVVGLDSPLLRAWVYHTERPVIAFRKLVIAIFTGFFGGFFILLLDKLFQPFMPSTVQVAEISIEPWKGLLASFYGGITEELLMRLFLMTLITWLIWKIFQKGQGAPTALVFWIAIVAAALLFGAGHLPTAADLWPLTTMVVTRTILLNAVGGIAFGFFYWRWGLEYAVIAHFFADIAIHGFGGI
ncbi:MAG: CPBP family intramembrane metalloprotease [Candidatus Marinimicrobia bacterium]|nr:CPBP family intramembrane metalloprotease [Candidatus Neomarinimicrobiota bacterium]